MAFPNTPEQQLRQDIAGFYADPYGYVIYNYKWGEGELIGFDGPDKWQEEVLKEIGRQVEANIQRIRKDERAKPIRIAVASGHGIGKSALTGWLNNWLMDTRPMSHGTVTANTSAQLETKTWAEITKWRRRGLTSHWFRVAGGRGSMKMVSLAMPDNWFCSAQTCREENSESFAGQHAQGATSFYIFDEASAVPAKIWEVSEGGLLSSTEAMHFVFGNPTQNTGKFRECFGKDRNRWTTFQIDSRKAKLPNKEEIKEWEDTYGEDSDFFRVRVKGVFPRAGSKQFIPNDIVDAAAGKVLHPSMYLHKLKIMGVDIAREGDDTTAFIRRRGLAAYKLQKFRGLKAPHLAGRIAEAIKQEELDHVFLDMGNIGAAIYDILIDWGYEDTVTGVWFSGRADKPDIYYNKRMEMYGAVRDWLELGGAIPDDTDLQADLIGPEYMFTNTEQYQLESAKDMKKRGLASPDCGFALGLTFAYPVEKASKHGRKNTQAKTKYNLFNEELRQNTVQVVTDYDLFG